MPEIQSPSQLVNAAALYVLSVITVIVSMYVVDYVYMTYIQPEYFYFLMEDAPVDPARLYRHIAIVLLCSLALPKTMREPSSYAIWFMYFYLLLPLPFVTERMHELLNSSSEVLYLWCISFVVLTWTVRILPDMNIFVRPKYFKHIDKIVISITLITVILAFPYINLTTLTSFNDVYDWRLEAREVTGNFRLLGYLLAFVGGGAIPYLMARGFEKNNAYIKLFAFALSIFLFLFDGSKSAIVIPIMLYAFGAFEKRNRKKSKVNGGMIMIYFVVFVAFTPILENMIFGTTIIANVLVRRVFIVPSVTGIMHYEFYSLNGITYMSESIGRFFMEPKYELSVSQELGRFYFNRPEMTVNTGILGSAYAQFGSIGSIFSAILAAIGFKIMDSFHHDNPSRYLPLMTVVYSAFIWSEQALNTSMLSSGIFFLIVLNYLSPYRRDAKALRRAPQTPVLSGRLSSWQPRV